MQKRSKLLVPALVGAFTALIQVIASAPAFREYVDSANGVTFHFPANWLVNRGGVSYLQPLILINDREPDQPFSPTVKVGLEGRDNQNGSFSYSNFVNAMFFYRVAPELSEAQCSARANPSSNYPAEEGWTTTSQIIGGVRFEHLSGGQAGLCNRNTEDLYATFHRGKCFLFEKNIVTTCRPATPHDIGPAEVMQIDRTMDGVLQSVRFGQPVTGSAPSHSQ
jgi:hypothetical protein